MMASKSILSITPRTSCDEADLEPARPGICLHCGSMPLADTEKPIHHRQE